MGTAELPEALRAAEALLQRRRHPKWVSLSWLALRPLISSINQVLIAASPTLVPELRRSWDEQLDGGTDRVVDQSAAEAFVLLGDPGEQDRSQYIVVPALREVVRRERPAFGVICSDVIYPSGDVNDYVHGLYVPYGPTPPDSPDSPGSGGSDAKDPSRDVSVPPPPRAAGELERLPLFAIPGNHDWHDGLSGFMQHFCATGPLDRARLGWPAEPLAGGRTWPEAVRRMLLRRPDHFRPQPLWRGAPTDPHTGDLTLEQFRDLRGPRPAQPGSYFAIRMRDLTVVAIDTGVGRGGGDSAIDCRQGRWLEQISARPGPKVLLTGNPLLVNAEWHECAIDPPLADDADEPAGHRTVNEIVDDAANGYVAVIGGDIHNFQHYVVERPQAPPSRGTRPVHHVVSGGAGAYMSATHPVRVVQQIRRRSGEQPARAPITDLPDSMAPTAVESLRHFTRQLLPRLWRIERALLAMAGGIGAGAAVVSTSDGPAGDGTLLAWLGLALAASVVLRVALPSQALRRPGLLTSLYRPALVGFAALVGLTGAIAVAWLDPGHRVRPLLAWAALATGGCLVAWLTRRTGWWRDPSWPHERLAASTLALVSAVGIGSVLGAGGLGRWALEGELLPPTVFGLPSDRLWAVPAVVVAVIGLVGVASFAWLRPSTPGGRWWRTWAPPVSYLAQVLGALVILSCVVFPQVPSLPWAVLGGVALLVLTAGLALAAAAVALRLACLPARDRWRARWGELGHWGQLGTAAAVVILLCLQLLASRPGSSPGSVRGVMLAQGALALSAGVGALVVWWRTRTSGPPLAGAVAVLVACGQAAFATLDGAQLQSTFRAQLGTQLTLATVVLLALVIDALRQVRRGATDYKPLAVIVVGAVAGLTALLDRWLGWLVHSAVASACVIVLVLLAVVLSHLTYLGAYTLITDLGAHRDGEDLLTEAEARTFLDWRVDPSRRSPLPPVLQRRAKMVFPSTDKPQGPIQKYVAEIFDSDNPPFCKNFLLLRTEAGRLVIDVHLVRGDGPISQDAQPRRSIVIPLVTSGGPRPEVAGDATVSW